MHMCDTPCSDLVFLLPNEQLLHVLTPNGNASSQEKLG